MIRGVSWMKHVGSKKGSAIRFMVFILGMVMTNLAPAEGGDIEKGKTLYRQSCGHCHGLDAKGDGEMGGYLNPPPANLASEKTQSKSDTELIDVIMKGRSGTAMEGFEGALEEGQLHDLLAYLRSLKP